MRRFALLVFMMRAVSAQTYSSCDINHDGAVNIVDVQLMINQVLGTSTCTTLSIDGSCDITAVQRVINAALGQACVTSSPDVTNGLVGYWKMDESSGTTAHDSSGLGYDGTTAAAGTFAWQPTGGKINGAIENYSANPVVAVPSNSQINFTGDFSVAFWVKPTSSVQSLLWKSVNDPITLNVFQGYGILLYNTNLYVMLDGNCYNASQLQVSSGQWDHIVAAKSGGTLAVYVNGVAENPITVTAATTATTNPLNLSVGGGGLLDDVRLYNRALSASEVQTIMNSNGSYVGTVQVPPPSVTSFTANPAPITAGQSSTLSWAVSGAASLSIDNGVGSESNLASGMVSVSPAVTTSYTLTAVNSAGVSSTALATVVVNQPASAPSTNIVITSPAANALISGNVNLAVSINDLPDVATVEYLYAKRQIYNAGDPVGPFSSPYSYTWNSNNEWDSYGQFTAQALDSSGNVLATSAPIPVQIANGTYTMKQTNPVSGPSATGVVTWTEAFNVNPSAGAIYCWVDGIPVNNAATSFVFDTTHLPNGFHDFHCTYSPTQGGTLPVAMSSQQIYVDNGQTPMQLRANFNTIYLTPGQAQTLTASMAYTNGVESPVTATYSVDNSSVATVGSDGTVTAVAPGIANVNVSAAAKCATVQVIVNASSTFPHFSRGGQVLTAYDPVNSIFVRAVFQGPGWADFQADSTLVVKTAAAGINTLGTGFYQNPADQTGWTSSNYSNQSGTFTAWQSYFNYINGMTLSYLTANNWSVSLTGDDIDRNGNELIDSVLDPYSVQKIQYAMQYWQATGRVIGIDMIDEADGDYGCDPLNTSASYWAQWDTAFTTSPFATLESIIKAVPHPNIAWPTIAIGSPICLGNWQGNPSFADYTDLYYDNGGFFYPEAESNYANRVNPFNQKLSASLPYMQAGKPVITLVGFTGPAFDKNVAGTTYIPGVDTLDRAGSSPQQVALSIFMEIAKGSAGVRLFSWQNEVYLNTPISAGTTYAFWGTSPYYGLSRWNAMSAAFNLEQTLNAYILSPMTNAIDLGPYVQTGAKSGSSGNLLIAINDLDNVQAITPNLAPYVTGAPVTRYRLWGTQESSESLGSVTSDQVTLNPGEVVIYAFPAQ